MFSKKEFATVSNLTFISRTNFMRCRIEHEKKSFITSGREHIILILKSRSNFEQVHFIQYSDVLKLLMSDK